MGGKSLEKNLSIFVTSFYKCMLKCVYNFYDLIAVACVRASLNEDVQRAESAGLAQAGFELRCPSVPLRWALSLGCEERNCRGRG